MSFRWILVRRGQTVLCERTCWMDEVVSAERGVFFPIVSRQFFLRLFRAAARQS